MSNQNQRIQLVSPVMSHIPGYILDNSRCTKCRGIQTKASSDPKIVQNMLDMLKEQAGDTAVNLTACTCEVPTLTPLVKQNQYKGKTVCICGSGPSLKRSARRIRRGEFDHVWGCNDALRWLTDNGYKCTHGLGIDQSSDLYTGNENEKCWVDPPDVPYLLATSVDPKLCDHLRAHGREFTHFHSFIGFDGEYDLYALLYDYTLISGEGLNCVNRAVGVAEFMGYDKVYVAGMDCAFKRLGWREIDGVKVPNYGFHVQGDPVEGIVLQLNPEFLSEVGGRHWATKPDMLISAISMVATQRRMGSKLELLGDVLPKALRHKDQEFLDRCIKWVTKEEQAQFDANDAALRFAPNLDSGKIQALLDGKAA